MIPAGAALLANSGWSRTPRTLGQGLGAAGQAFSQAYNQNAMQTVQADEMLRQRAAAQTAAQQAAQKHAAWQKEQALKMQEIAGMKAWWQKRGGDPNTPLSEIKASIDHERALRLEEAKAGLKAQSTIGKLVADRDAGRITEEEFQIGVAAAKKPLVDMTANPMKELDAKWVSENQAKWNDASEAGLDADQGLADIENMLGNGMKTGGGQTILNTTAKWAQNVLGLDVDLTNAASAEKLTSTVNQLIAPKVKLLGVNPTDRDLQFIQEIFPSISNTLEGNLYVSRILRRRGQRDRAIAAAVNRVRNDPTYARDPGAMRVAMRNAASEIMASYPAITDQERQAIARIARGASGGDAGLPALKPLPGSEGTGN